jgi:hypothetical protein
VNLRPESTRRIAGRDPSEMQVVFEGSVEVNCTGRYLGDTAVLLVVLASETAEGHHRIRSGSLPSEHSCGGCTERECPDHEDKQAGGG